MSTPAPVKTKAWDAAAEKDLSKYLRQVEREVQSVLGPLHNAASIAVDDPQLSPPHFTANRSLASRERSLSKKQSMRLLASDAAGCSTDAAEQHVVDYLSQNMLLLLEVALGRLHLNGMYSGALSQTLTDDAELEDYALEQLVAAFGDALTLQGTQTINATLGSTETNVFAYQPSAAEVAQNAWRENVERTVADFCDSLLEGESVRQAASGPLLLSEANIFTASAVSRSTQTYSSAEGEWLGAFRVKQLQPSHQLLAAIQREAWIEDTVLSTLLPFVVTRAVPTLLQSGQQILRTLSNVERLERLVAVHTGLPPDDDGDLLSDEERACPAAVNLLRRFATTPRFPADFREGVAPANTRYFHEEDPVLAAYPCVYLPTSPLLDFAADADTSAALEIERASRMHHAWLFACVKGVFLLVDASDTTQQVLSDCSLYAHLPLEERLRKVTKLRDKRRQHLEDNWEQLRNDCLLLQLVDYKQHYIALELGQNSVAFANRTASDMAPPLVGAPAPRIDRLMELYPPSSCTVDPQELSQQLYCSLVLQVLRWTERRAKEVSKYSIVFPSETMRSAVVTLFAAGLHPSRSSLEVFSTLANSPRLATALPSLCVTKASTATVLPKPVDPVSALYDAAAPTRADALASSSPLVRFAEPVQRSSSSDWYPAALLGLDEATLTLCRQLHIHPFVLLGVQTKLFVRPEVEWLSLMDIAIPLMGATNAHIPNLVVAERVAEHYTQLGFVEPVEVILRNTSP